MTGNQKRGIVIFFILITSFIIVLHFYEVQIPAVSKPANEISTSSDTLQKSNEIYLSFDLENTAGLGNPTTVIESKFNSKSGSHTNWYNKDVEYGATILIPFNRPGIKNNIDKIDFTFHLLSKKKLHDVFAVVSIENSEQKALFYETRDIIQSQIPSFWEKCSFTYVVSDYEFKSEDLIKIYIWNKSRQEFYVDDLIARIRFR